VQSSQPLAASGIEHYSIINTRETGEVMMIKALISKAASTIAMAGLCCIGVAAQTTGAEQPAATHAARGKQSASDRVFMLKAAEGAMAEVELGQLATQKASSPEVKQFGQRMVDDHSKAGDQLKQIASQEGVKLPNTLNAKHAATKSRLEKLSGEAFDRAYIQNMVAYHTKDVGAFKREARAGRDPELKNFASQTAPTIEDHLKQAQGIAPQVAQTHKKAASPSTSGME
jgi:putative membrane protein